MRIIKNRQRNGSFAMIAFPGKKLKHLAENMSVIDLRHLCVKEAASMIECYAMGNTEGMLHEFYELKLAVCALAEHLPEMLPEVAKKKAVDGYFSMFIKE